MKYYLSCLNCASVIKRRSANRRGELSSFDGETEKQNGERINTRDMQVINS